MLVPIWISTALSPDSSLPCLLALLGVFSFHADRRLLSRRALCSALEAAEQQSPLQRSGIFLSTTLPPQYCPLARDALITLDLQFCSTEGTCLTLTA